MKTSNVTISLAPLQGLTDRTFRNVFVRHFSGVDEAVAPFISTMGSHQFKQTRLKDVKPDKNTLPVVPQIMGNVADDFIFLCRRLADQGHTRVNWNLGCPHAKVANKKRGSGLLEYPEDIQHLLERIVPKISQRLSVKVRLGRKSKDDIFRLLPVFDAQPLEEIILHPRTGEQIYTGTCDLEAFKQIMAASRHKLVYNGDITDVESFNFVKDRFPDLQRIMIGRGLLANPFLAEQIKGIEVPGHKDERMKAFHDDLLDAYRTLFSGPGHLIGRLKGLWTYFGPNFNAPPKALKPILKSNSIEKYQKAVDLFFSGKTFQAAQNNSHDPS